MKKLILTIIFVLIAAGAVYIVMNTSTFRGYVNKTIEYR